MYTTISFKVDKWQYNKNAPLTNTHTDLILHTFPVRQGNRNIHSEAVGVSFKWMLVLQGEGLEILYYSYTEMVLIPQENRNDADIKKIAEETYDKSYEELAMRNLAVGLDAGFPPFRLTDEELKGIKEVLSL